MKFSDEYEQRDFMENLFKYLPPSEQRLLKMYFFEDMTQKEIGQRFGVKSSGVQNFLLEILKDCRRIVGILLEDSRESVPTKKETITPKSLLYDHSRHSRRKLVEKRKMDKIKLAERQERKRLHDEQREAWWKRQKTNIRQPSGTVWVDGGKIYFQCG